MQDIHDIKEIIEILPFWRQHLYLILTLILLCLGILLFLYIRKTKVKRSLQKIETPQLPPYEEALKALLEAEELMKPGLDKILSTKLSDLIRKYLEDTFHIPVSEKTTEEFLYDIQNNSIFNTKSLEILSMFLEMCDLAKFAKVEFSHNEQKLIFEKATLFLELARKEELKILEEKQKQLETK